MIDVAIAELATRQRGVFSLEQALDLGATHPMIRHRLEQGRWRQVRAGVYLIAGTPESRPTTLMAACLWGGTGSAVSHRSAVALWTKADLADPLEVTTPRETRRPSPAVLVHRSRDLLPSQVTTVDQLPVTTPSRTLVDVGQVVPVWEVRTIVERFLAHQLVTVPNLQATLLLHGRQGRRGVGSLRRVLDERALGDVAAESVLEAAMADLCRRAGLPTPEFQYEVVVRSQRRRLDFAYPDVQLAIEVDGYAFHSSRRQFEADRIRDNQLGIAGWMVLRFTWNQVVHQPTYVIATIRRALENLGKLMSL